MTSCGSCSPCPPPSSCGGGVFDCLQPSPSPDGDFKASLDKNLAEGDEFNVDQFKQAGQLQYGAKMSDEQGVALIDSFGVELSDQEELALGDLFDGEAAPSTDAVMAQLFGYLDSDKNGVLKDPNASNYS